MKNENTSMRWEDEIMSDVEAGELDSGRWEKRYVDNDLPWDNGVPDLHLQAVVTHRELPKGRALEIGCGTGTNAIWLEEQGWDVMGIDLSPTAIERARKKAQAAGARCEWAVLDFLPDPVPGAPFDVVYDRGCFHTFQEERERFTRHVSGLLKPGGVWHSLIGSTDGPPRDGGPPRRSAQEVMTAVEPHFEVLELNAVSFDQGLHSEARAWVLVARRRDQAGEVLQSGGA